MNSSDEQTRKVKKDQEQEQNLGRLILKTCQALQNNKPLSQSDTTTVLDGINKFFSHYTPPDHPPYHLMIERAIRELNEKGGSSMGSISDFLEKEYANLPLPHLTLLKHHLVKLCQSGSIVLKWGTKYILSGTNNNPNGMKRKKITNMPMVPCKKQVLEVDGFQQHGQVGILQKPVVSGFQNRVYGQEDMMVNMPMGENSSPCRKQVMGVNGFQQHGQIGIAQKNVVSGFQNRVHGQEDMVNMPMVKNTRFKKQVIEKGFQQHRQIGFVQKHMLPGLQNTVSGQENTGKRLMPRRLDFNSNFQHQWVRPKALAMLVEEEKYEEKQDLVRLSQQENAAGMWLVNKEKGQEEQVKEKANVWAPRR